MMTQQDIPTDPTVWHRYQGKRKECPVCTLCGCPRSAVPYTWQMHRATTEADKLEAKWLVKSRASSVWAIMTDGTRSENVAMTDETRNRLDEAARLAAWGIPKRRIAKELGVKHDTLADSIRAHPRHFAGELQELERKGRPPLVKPTKEKKPKIPGDARKGIRHAAAAIAAGLTWQEAAASLGV